VLNVSGAPTWLWGTWVNQWAGQSDFLYMVLTEGPVCAVGTIALLLVILGVVLAIGNGGQQPLEYAVEDEEPVEEPYTY